MSNFTDKYNVFSTAVGQITIGVAVGTLVSKVVTSGIKLARKKIKESKKKDRA